jgi:hypothetical protein
MTRGLIVASAVPPVVTAVVLVLAALNRAGALEPLVLSERELSLRPRSDDNSVATMDLQWQQQVSRDGWFDCVKLEALGLDCGVEPGDVDAARHYGRLLPRRAFVAFEMGGPAWEKLMAERARDMEAGARQGTPVRARAADDFREHSSRLVAVDADLDAATLRQRHPDPTRHLITAAVVRAVLMAPLGELPYITGMVERVDPGALYVPTELATQLPAARRAFDPGQRPRYRVSVRYGRRLEPWIVAIGR